MKYIFFLTIVFYAFLIAPTTYACDPLGCIFGGHKQDALILGEIMSASENSCVMKVVSIFPQTHIKSLRKGDTIKVGFPKFTIEMSRKPIVKVGEKYFISLIKKDDNLYGLDWGFYEITGTTFSDARLVENKNGDDAALQIFINSGGIEKDFYFDGDKAFLRAKNGETDKQIYPALSQIKYNKMEEMPIQKKEKNILWYGGILGILVLLGSILLITKTKK